MDKIQAHPPFEGSVRDTPRVPAVLLIALAVLAVVLAGAVWAWAHYGTAIFFEMIAAGIAACF